MSAITAILLCMFALLPVAGRTRAKEWRGVVPLRSTRADVERLIGKPHLKSGNPDIKYGLYDFEDERVDILYSNKPCTRGAQGSWNVPPDTVISIRIVPKKEVRFSDLQLDVSKYKISDGGHVPGYTYYTNEEEGIRFEVVKGEITSISYFPSAKDNHLRCPEAVAKQPCKQ